MYEACLFYGGDFFGVTVFVPSFKLGVIHGHPAAAAGTFLPDSLVAALARRPPLSSCFRWRVPAYQTYFFCGL